MIVYGFVATLLPFTAFTVKVTAPAWVGAPPMTPADNASPGGSVPRATLHVGVPAKVSVARYASPVWAGLAVSDSGEIVPAAVAGPTELTAIPPNSTSEAIAPSRNRLLLDPLD